MNRINEFRNQLSREITQKHELQKKVIAMILTSKRLLSEHLENLEEVGNLLDDNCYLTTSNHLTLLSTTSILLGSFGLFSCFRNNARYIFPCSVGAIPILYLQKVANRRELVWCEGAMKDLIKSLDDFELFVKKATTVLNDAQYVKTQTEGMKRYLNQNRSLNIDIWNITKRVIRSLYCTVKYLELHFRLTDERFRCYYDEIEDVDNCEVMILDVSEDVSTGKIKELFSLFAYVQSYLLFRVGFVIATNVDEAKNVIKKYVFELTTKIKTQTNQLPSFILARKEENELQGNIQKLMSCVTETKTVPKGLIQIRSSTADFSLKILMLLRQVNAYQQTVLDYTSHNDTTEAELKEIFDSLNTIGSQISQCMDEQGRLQVLISKHFKKELGECKFLDKENEAVSSNDAANQPLLCIVGDEETQSKPQNDDFFYLDPEQESTDNKQDDPYATNGDLDEENLQKKVTKRCFKPVLEQLRERIVEIDSDMKEREKKVLKEKGIEISERLDECSLDLGSDDEDDNKVKKNFHKYQESREFLNAKSQVNLFGSANVLPIIKSNFISLQEEVLE